MKDNLTFKVKGSPTKTTNLEGTMKYWIANRTTLVETIWNKFNSEIAELRVSTDR